MVNEVLLRDNFFFLISPSKLPILIVNYNKFKKKPDNLTVNWHLGTKVLVATSCKYDGFSLEYKYFGFALVYYNACQTHVRTDVHFTLLSQNLDTTHAIVSITYWYTKDRQTHAQFYANKTFEAVLV